jgi:membrane-associated phospholipid phosphatase
LIELQKPDIIGLIGFVFLLGFIASSRLLLKAHTSKEIIQGFLIGIAPGILYCITRYSM